MKLHDMIRLPLRLVPRKARVPVLSGPLKGHWWIVGAATHGCWLGTYEREAQDLFSRCLRPGDVIYDIGANVGFFSLLASKLVGPTGHVIAFEPLPSNAATLSRHTALNRIANVQLLPVALSDAPGRARFRTAMNPAMGSLAPDGDIDVEVSSVDTLIAEGRIPLPSFMKIDVEGAEHNVLRGAASLLQTRRPVILLSEHGWEQHRLCTTLLIDAGYSIELVRDGADDGNYVLLATTED